MSNTTKHLTIQALLLTAWTVIIIITQTSVRVDSQTACEQLPYMQTPPLGSWPNFGWPQVHPITVKIDASFSPVDKEAIEEGISKWNTGNCSNVRFIDFGYQWFENYQEEPPNETLYVMRTAPQAVILLVPLEAFMPLAE